MRESDGLVMTHAGPEIGVASTKAFMGQLVSSLLLALRIGQARGTVTEDTVRRVVDEVRKLPQVLARVLDSSDEIRALADRFQHAQGLPLPRPRHLLPGRARGRAEAEGDLVHPRRGLPGGRDEARARSR